MVVVFTGIFAAGGFVFRSCGGSDHLTWEDKIDLVCYVAYSKMSDAASKADTARTTSEARIEHDFVDQLDRQRGGVPVSVLLNYNGFVNAHRRIAMLRDQRAALIREKRELPPGFVGRLDDAQVSAQLAAQDLHLGVCGQVDPKFE